MNINAQELMLVRRNMKFGETKLAEQPTSPATEPIAKPETGMKALEMQANNNIAFHSKQTVFEAVRRKAAPHIVRCCMAVAAPLLVTSCIDMNQEFIADLTVLNDIKDLLKDNKDLLSKLLEEQKVGNEIQQKALKIQEKNNKTLEDMATIQKLDYKETQKISNALTQGIANIIEQLKADGATDKEILAVLNAFNGNVDKLLNEFLTKGGSVGELLEKIEQAIKDATDVLNAILKEVQDLRATMNQNFEDLNLTMLDQTTILKMIFLEQQDQTALLDSMKNNQEGMAENLEILKEDNKILAKYVVENGDKVLNYLASLDKNSAEFAEEAEKWSLLGVDIRAILEKHSVNTDEGMKALKEAIENNGKRLDKLTELVDIHFADANAKLAFIAKYLPELKNDPALRAEIEKLAQVIDENTSAVNNNTATTEKGIEELKGVNAKLDKILEKMDKVIDNTSDLARYIEDQKENWGSLFKHLNKGTEILDSINNEQKITNEKIDGFKDAFGETKESVKTIENYTYILTQQMNKLQKSIDELENNGNNVGGMTVEEYYNATLELDAINRTHQAEDIKKIIDDTVTDKLITVNQWLESIDGKLANAKDYTDSFNKLFAIEQQIYDLLTKLANTDFSNPDYTDTLNALLKIMKEYKHVCDCMQNNTPGTEEIPNPDELEKRFN